MENGRMKERKKESERERERPKQKETDLNEPDVQSELDQRSIQSNFIRFIFLTMYKIQRKSSKFSFVIIFVFCFFYLVSHFPL